MTRADVSALACAWGQGMKEWMHRHSRPRSEAAAASCGHWNVSLALGNHLDLAAPTRKLRELLRLLALAASLGPDVFRTLTVGKITSRDNLSGQLSLPVLTKLRIKKGWHPEVLTMIRHTGASLTHLRLALDYDSDGVDVAETIASHCPLVSHLGVCDAERAFVDALVAACDDGRLRRLRQIAMYHDRRPMRLTDRSFALACIRLLQILSDPSRRLAQVMEKLFVLVPPQDFASVEQATDLMLRCNSMLVDIAVQRCMHFTHHQADMQPSHHSEGEGVHAADGRDTAVIAMIREMADNGPRENVVLHNGLLRDVVILPSLRRRLALMSVLTARGVHLPEAVLKGVVAMSGRNARRRIVFVCDEP
ncbi:hypothetical protein ATCC90586_005473 [Pythium insidiosum]|nr:hypothetical protein ATCC90586_005473 [Pythium insidiosum]